MEPISSGIDRSGINFDGIGEVLNKTNGVSFKLTTMTQEIKI